MFSLGQGFFDLPENGGNRSALSFEEAQTVPQPDDFAFSLGAHWFTHGSRHRERKENEWQAARYWG